MANKRMDDLGFVIQHTLDREFKRITNDIENDVMDKVAGEIEVIVRREMRMAGVRRSEQTGTHEKRSADEKENVYYKHGGTILQTGHRVAEYGNEVIAYGGVPSGRDYVARMLDQGTERRMAWHHSKEQGNRQEPMNFLEKAAKTVHSSIEAMTKKGIQKALGRIRPTTVRRKVK
jgi:hypothetical protein